MPITPRESIAGHRFSYDRLRASRGGGTRTRTIGVTPPCTTRAALAGARCPAQLTSFCPTPSKHLGKPANSSPGREAQRGGAPGPACAQGSPVRCGCARCRQARPAAVVRTRTHTSTRAQRCLRSAHTQNKSSSEIAFVVLQLHCDVDLLRLVPETMYAGSCYETTSAGCSMH